MYMFFFNLYLMHRTLAQVATSLNEGPSNRLSSTGSARLAGSQRVQARRHLSCHELPRASPPRKSGHWALIRQTRKHE